MRAVIPTLGVHLEFTLEASERLDLINEWRHARDAVSVEEVILEDGELLRRLDRVVSAVGLPEEVMHLRRGELVAVAAIDSDENIVARRDEAPVITTDEVRREELLRHRHGVWFHIKRRDHALPRCDALIESEESPILDDRASDLVVARGELCEGDLLARL